MKARKPEGLFTNGPEVDATSSAGRFALDQLVMVQLWQRVPPGDPDGEWKDTGRGFSGIVTNGPKSSPYDGDKITERTVYVMPSRAFDHDNRRGEFGNTHPRPINEEPFTIETGTDGSVQTLKFVVEAVSAAHQVQLEAETA